MTQQLTCSEGRLFKERIVKVRYQAKRRRGLGGGKEHREIL